jgi:small conductance mechanosensitive channel
MHKLWDSLVSQVVDFAPKLLVAIAILVAFWIVGRLARSALRRLAGRFEGGKRQVLHLAGGIVYGSCWVVGIVTALGSVGLNVSALVAGLGLGGFAVGFAMRDALSNLLAGVMILLHRPFDLGSTISVSGFEGVVTEINLRYTVLAGQSKRYLVPNSILLANTIAVSNGKE